MTWALFDKATRKLAERIIVLKESGVIKSIYGISRGGLVVAVRLSHMLDLPLILNSKDKNSLIATLYYNEISAVIPKFWIFKKKDKWIVFPWET